MDRMMFFAVCGIGVLLLATHSWRTRGAALTFNFFLFSFMLTFTKGGTHVSHFVDVSGAGLAPLGRAASVTLLWMLAFYLAWWMGEKIAARIAFFRGRLFPVLLFSGIAVAAFALAVETTAVRVGWWQVDAPGFPWSAVSRWFFFSVYFLAAYFLIACSELSDKDWKTVFFILPFIHSWVPRFFGPGLPQAIEKAVVLAALVVLAFASPLRMKYPVFCRRPGAASYFPPAVAVAVLCILAALAQFKAGGVAPAAAIPALALLLLSAGADKKGRFPG